MATSQYRNKRILLVEDDAQVREVLKSFLNHMGIEYVYEAGNGYEALQFIDDNPNGPDLVICDWNMPGMSGYSVFRQFRTTHPKMPFIMVTARNDFESVRVAKEGGLQSYLVKPLTMEQFEQKVTNAFRTN